MGYLRKAQIQGAEIKTSEKNYIKRPSISDQNTLKNRRTCVKDFIEKIIPWNWPDHIARPVAVRWIKINWRLVRASAVEEDP